MADRRKIPINIQEQVRQRAHNLCEYCHTAEQWQYVPFTIDHIIPLSKGGTESVDNLALACFHCNRRKSNRLAAIDPDSDEEAPLFNPRQHKWADHFIWSVDKLQIVGLTSIGRATIEALGLNRERVVNIRAADMTVNRHPPPQDSVQISTGETS